MPVETQIPEIEWKDDARPLAVCMMCNKEFPVSETECPECHVALCRVHRCPQCSRTVSVKHLRCPYCTRRFTTGEELESPMQPGSSPDRTFHRAHRPQAPRRGRQLKLISFSILIFVIVFTFANLLLSNRPLLFGRRVMGSSYVLHDIAVRHTASGQTFATSRVPAGAVVEITDVQLDSQGESWFEIRRDKVAGYVPVNELAPPKGANAETGYRLLKSSLTSMTDPSESSDAVKAVGLYRRLYSFDSRARELVWILAEKNRLWGTHARSREMIDAAREGYQELATADGEYSVAAKSSLRQLPDFTDVHVSGAQRRSAAGREIVGGSSNSDWKVVDDGKPLPHKLLLLNKTRVLVSLSPTEQMQAGALLAGRIAANVVSSHEVVIRAGSACTVRVISLSRAKSSRNALVDLQLQTMEIGGQSYAVETMPVHLSLSTLSAKSESPVPFRLQRTLFLSR
jgi:hypothetical protein